MYLIKTYAQIRDVQNSRSLEPALPTEVQAGSSNPIDFDALYEQNIDIYAWLYIPGTNINFPICQSDSDDTYYLNHTAARQESELGAIFSEHQFNKLDFLDRVTILYGHNGFGNTMFTDLHQFEHSSFFDAHDKVYVYAPGHIYTYEIASAFMSDDRHIMAKYNFQTDDGFSRFVDDALSPDVLGANSRSVEVDANSKVLVLSTCNTGALEATGRYLVCGVMVDDRTVK